MRRTYFSLMFIMSLQYVGKVAEEEWEEGAKYEKGRKGKGRKRHFGIHFLAPLVVTNHR